MGPSGAARPGLDIDLGEDIDTGVTSLLLSDCLLFMLLGAVFAQADYKLLCSQSRIAEYTQAC